MVFEFVYCYKQTQPAEVVCMTNSLIQFYSSLICLIIKDKEKRIRKKGHRDVFCDNWADCLLTPREIKTNKAYQL